MSKNKTPLVAGRVTREKYKRFRVRLAESDVSMVDFVNTAVDLFIANPQMFKITPAKPAAPDLFSASSKDE